MEVQQGTKFIFFVVPVFIICIIVILFLFSGNTQPPIEKNDETIYGSEEEQMNFTELNIEITEEGTGREAEPGDEVAVHYRGTLRDGTEFDSSYNRGEPYTFVLGIGEVIQGWDQGIVGMKVGEKRRLEIPSNLGYGEGGSGIIPPNAGLIFETELVEIK